MKNQTVARNSMIGIDVSGDERRAFLRQLQRSPLPNRRVPSSTLTVCLIGTDVSKSDPRSVKAQLAGQGAWRAQWWNFNCFVCRVLNPRLPLENVMYAFHRRHHWLTLAWLEFVAEHKQGVDTLECNGIYEGLRILIARERAKYSKDEA